MNTNCALVGNTKEYKLTFVLLAKVFTFLQPISSTIIPLPIFIKHLCFSVCDLYTVVINKMKLSAFAAFAHPLLTLFYFIADRVIRG